jgi:Uncharacterized protein conserved in bacteria
MKFREFIKSSHLKPWDGIIVVLLILVSFLPIVLFSWQQTTVVAAETQAVLRVDGKEIRTFELYEGQKSYTFKYEDPDGDYNLIEVEGTRIRIKDANCGDLICVRRGWASKNGDTIVCLPHKLVIEVQALDGGDMGELDY